jgi:D-alanyl-D-alanine carboxypeptidase/D-alanyl-D-alanine-endopeptidase (penicillin-binding protein 4)
VRRVLRWLVVAALAAGVLAGSAVAWQQESDAADARPPGEPVVSLGTPVLSARRLPSVLAAPIAGRRLVADLTALTPFLPADSCLVVEGPDVSFAHRGDAALVPASTQKLLTATAVLETLEEDTRLRTTVVASVDPADGVVRGDLTLVGGGDPLLATADYVSRFERQPQTFTDLDTLAADVQRAGVVRVEGSIVGDESRYDRARYVAGWPARYIDQNVTGPLSALAVNDGFARYPTEQDPSEPLEPASDPAVEAAAVFTRLLEARGIEVAGGPGSGTAPTVGVEVAAVESPPLNDVVGQLLRESDNSTAELLLKEVGRTAGEPTTGGGASVVRELHEDLGPSTVADGSGLSLDDRVSCQLLVDVLRRPGTGERIDDLLAVAGRSGTLLERFVGTPLEGVLRAKTGSLTSVASLAGVVEDGDPPLHFALVVNVPPPGRVPDGVAELQRQVGEALARWPSVPDADALGPLAVEG